MRYLQPSCVEEELQQGENRNVHVHSVILVSFLWVQELPADHTEAKKWIDCNSNYLHAETAINTDTLDSFQIDDSWT